MAGNRIDASVIALAKGKRGKLLSRIQQSFADMNDEQIARTANLIDAFMES